MLAPCDLNLYFYIVFHGPYAKKIININDKIDKNLDDFLSTHTSIKHHNKTLFMENLNPKCDKNKYKNCQIVNLTNEKETKNKKNSI
jgi:hypothetical protein